MRPGGAAKSAAVLAETARRAAGQAGQELPVERAVVGAAGAGRAQEQRELEAALREAGVARRGGGLAGGGGAPPPALRPRPRPLLNPPAGSPALPRRPNSRGGARRRGWRGAGCGRV